MLANTCTVISQVLIYKPHHVICDYHSNKSINAEWWLNLLQSYCSVFQRINYLSVVFLHRVNAESETQIIFNNVIGIYSHVVAKMEYLNPGLRFQTCILWGWSTLFDIINRFSLSKYVYVANFIKTNLKTLVVRYDDVWLLSDAPDVSFKHNGCISLIRITQRPPADHMANIISGVSTILLMGWCVFRHKCTTRSCTRTNLISVTANLQQRKWL